MENFEAKNTVKSTNQVSQFVYSLSDTKGKPRILFLGNSITKHGKAPQIGWNGDWGMAASSEDKDYVHICMQEIKEKYPEASFFLVQGAEWERAYKDCDLEEKFSSAKDFNPDVIICCLCANVPEDYFEHDSFIKAMHNLHQFLSGHNTKIIVTSSFFNNEKKNNAIRDYCEKYETHFVYISDIIYNKSNLAVGFQHEGIKIHPGDKGMAIIASRIMEKFNDIDF